MGKIIGRFLLPHPPVLIPQVGKEQAKMGETTISAFKKVGEKIKELAPDTIIIISPHAPLFQDHFYINENRRCSGDLAQFGHKEILLGFDCDNDLTTAIKDKAKTYNIRSGLVDKQILRRYNLSYDLDHGVIVPLYFICNFYSDFKLIPIGLTSMGPQDHYHLGEAIAEAVKASDKNVVIIASGDMSHKLKEDDPYGIAPEGKIFEEKIETLLKTGNITGLLSIDPQLEEKAAQCGLYSLYILCGTLTGFAMEAAILSHQWPFGVGYLIADIKEGQKVLSSPLKEYLEKRDEELKNITKKEDYPLALARMALAYYLDTGKELTLPQDLPEEWQEKSGGVFVSFKKDGALRGCIGTISATQPTLGEEIINNAIAAGTKDFRFQPITPGEIKDLTISIDVLEKPEDIDDISSLNPKIYGVIVSSNGKRGLLLPDLEGIDSPEEQVKIAREKAGIPFFKKVKLQRFKVRRYE